MPPKKQAKKGKKQEYDDAYWEAKAAALEAKSPLAADDDEDGLAPKPAGKGGKKGKGAGSLFDLLDEGDVEDDDGGGGLLDTINASKAKKDKKKKKKNTFDLGDDLDENAEIAGAPAEAVDTKPSMEDEWPEDDVKPRKGKKGKKGKAAPIDDADEEAEVAAQLETTKPNMDDEWPEEDVKPKKGKKGKKGKKQDNEEEDVDMDSPAVVAAPVEVEPPAASKAEEEWPEEDTKGKKGKKGKKGGKKAEEEEFDLDKEIEKNKAAAAAAAAAKAETKVEAPTQAPEDTAADAEDADEDDGPKILTKAQKEKLKKEKEKAKKKAQAAAKKASTTEAAPEPASPTIENAPAAEAEEEDEAAEGPAGAGADKKNKKKKKPATKAEAPPPAAAPAGGKGKKVSAQIAAMQAAMAERQRLEDAARAAEAERIRKIEEEEARIAAEEAKAAELKAAKKAKEKEKLAKAKAEGRLLTPAQKREKAAAEARKQAMLASGVVVAGLAGKEDGEKKRVNYGKKKPAKKDAATKEKEEEKEIASPMEPASPAPAAAATVAEPIKSGPAPAEASAGDDDWDKSEDDAAAVEDVVAGVSGLKVDDEEDDWDKSSEDETPAPAPKAASAVAPIKPAPAAAPVSSKTTSAAPSKPAAALTAAKPAPTPNGKPAPKANGKPPADESSEEDSDEDDSDEDDSSEEETDSEDEAEMRKQRALQKIRQRHKDAAEAGSKEDLRSPICCILGHVDTGKTKLLDKIRQTSVQEGEAGGITQQIGATFFPKGAIQEKTAVVNKDSAYEVKIPGLLIIDTPGHESFTNLRTRGSSLCNIAILVVDITHGLEPQTIESLNLLRNGKTPFIVALNKIDRMYGWKAIPNGGFRETLAQQSRSVISEFEDRVKKTKLAFSEQGLNAEIFDENKNLGRNISLVPTSAITGEGIPDMLMLLVKLTQERMNQSLMYISELECTILEVKVIEGLGTTIDVVLSNGVMKEGDRIVLCGMDGPIVTNVRALLTPQPLRELRVKSAYVHHKEVKAALGVKISAPGLEKAIAGARLYVAQDDDEVEAYKDMAMEDLTSLARFVERSGKGVWVQASTLGSLEALLTFLQQMKIPVFNFGIGPIYKNTIVRAATMLDKAPEYAVILAFDVVIEKDAAELAQKAGLKVFSAMIIYHLFDAFTKYMAEVTEAKRQAAMPNAVWPCRLSILKAFAHRDPIILGVDLIEGTMRTGTPVGVVRTDKESGKREIIKLGKITSIEINHKPFETVKKAQIGAGAAVKIERAPYESAKLFGRHFDDKDEVVSLLSRQSIDTLKTSFRDQVDLSDWAIIKKMKVEQGIA